MKTYKYDFFDEKRSYFIDGIKICSVSMRRLLHTKDAVDHEVCYNNTHEITNEFLNALLPFYTIEYTLLRKRPYVRVKDSQRIYLDTAKKVWIEKSYCPCVNPPKWKDLDNFATPLVIEYLKERGLTTTHTRNFSNSVLTRDC